MREAGDYRLWSQNDGLFELAQFTTALDDRETVQEIEQKCPRSNDILQAFALSSELERPATSASFPNRAPSGHEPSSPARRRCRRTLRRARGHGRRSTSPGRRQSRTIVDALIEVESANVAVDTVEERTIARFLVDGEVLREDDLFENFRYRFDLPLATKTCAACAHRVQRYLEAGRATA